MSAIRLGEKLHAIQPKQIKETERVSISFNPSEIRPIFIETDKLKEMYLKLDLGSVLEAEPENFKGKKNIEYLRSSGMPLGELLYMIVSEPQAQTKEGVVLSFNAEIDQADQQVEATETTENKKKKKAD